MRLFLVFFCFCSFFVTQIYSNETEVYTRESTEEEILNRFVLVRTVFHEKDLYYVEIIKKAKNENSLSIQCDEFIKENYFYLDYLVKEEMVSYLNNKDENIKDPVEIVKSFSPYLKLNEDFSTHVADFFNLFLKSKGYEVANFVEEPKKVYTFEEFKTTAVRNVFPTKGAEEGKLIYKLCVGGEGYKDYPNRNIYLEAFAFEIIFKERNSDIFNKVLKNCEDVIKKLQFSTDYETLIKRVQGSIWSVMFLDERFANILKEGYNTKKNYLPFRITT